MRFHIGVSFRWKTIKKFLLPILLGILAFFGFNAIFSNLDLPIDLMRFLRVNAAENYNTYYNFEIEEDMFNLDKQFSTNLTYKDVLDNLITLSNDYYDFYIYLNKNPTLQNNTTNEIIVNLYRKNTSLNVQYSGQSSTSSPFSTKSNSSDYIVRQFKIRSSSSSSFALSSDIYTSLSNCLNNNICPGGYVSYNFGTSTNAFSFPDLFYKGLTTSFNNTDSFNLVGNNVAVSNLQGWFYYSTIPLIYSNSLYNSSSILLKNFRFNEIEVGIGQEFPTYLDLFPNEPAEILEEYSSSEIETYNFFNYQITPDIDYKLHLIFDSPTDDLDDRINFCLYGKKLTNNYYSYDQLSCAYSLAYNKDFNSITNLYHYDLTLSFTSSLNRNNIDLSNYLSLSSTLSFNNKYKIYNLQYNSPDDSIFIHNSFSGFTRDYVMDKYDYPKLFISSSSSNHQIWACSYKKVGYVEYRVGQDSRIMTLLDLDSSCQNNQFKEVQIYYQDYNYPIYFDSYPNEDNTLIFTFEYDTLVSFEDSSNDQQNYSFVDDEGNINTTDITDVKTVSSRDSASFFTNFVDSDPHGISSIVQMPLVLIRSVATEKSCTPVTFSVLGHDIDLPSGCSFWSRFDDDSKNLYYLFVCGLISYRLLVSLFKDINNLKDPNKSNINTLDL